MPRNPPTPTTITSDEFWATIDAAWTAVNDGNAHTLLASPNRVTREMASLVVVTLLTKMRNRLTSDLESYTLHELRDWNTHFNNAINHIADETGIEGDDGWLYRRCFVVGVGKAFFDKYCRDPDTYEMGVYAEEMGYVAMSVAKQKWGSYAALYDDKAVKEA